MNKKSFVGASRYIISALIAMQGLLILLFAVNALNNAYMHQWEQYGNQSGALNIYFNEDFTNSKDIEEYLYKEAINNNLFIIRKDYILVMEILLDLNLESMATLIITMYLIHFTEKKY